MNLRRVWLMARKETQHVLRDVRTVYMALGVPLVLLLLFGYALSSDVEHVALIVSDQDRTENIRRVGEVARLFYEQGNIVICTFISPFKADREFVRSILPSNAFTEVFVKCAIEVCRQRDPKGLYAKAEAGEIQDFTGISSPYEAPENAELVLETDVESAPDLVEKVMAYISTQA